MRAADSRMEMALECLACSGSVSLHLTGSSMVPTIWPGQLVTIRKSAGVRPGDVVAFLRRGELRLHRVVRIAGDRIRTKGDRHLWPDPWIDASSVCGRADCGPRPWYWPVFLSGRLTAFALKCRRGGR